MCSKLTRAINRLADELAIFNEAERCKSRADLVTKADLNETERIIMASQAELAASLRTAAGQLTKVRTEIQGVQTATDELKAKVTELEAKLAEAIANGSVTQELQDAVAEVVAQAQVVDDEIPDTPAPPPPPPPTE